MSRHVRAKAPRLATRPELSVNVPAPTAPLPQKNTPLSPSPKRRWFAKLASLVSRLRPAPRSPTSSSSSATTPSTATSSSAFSRSPAALTATWVNTTAQATAPATLNPRAWPASAISLQHPPRTQPATYAQDRTRHQSLGAVMQAQAPQPVPLYSIPPGPTALSPSPYMLGRTASASAATIARPQRERERGRRRGASVSQLQQFQAPQSAQPQASTSAYYSHAHAHAHTFPPTSHSAPALHGPSPSPKRSLPPRPAIPSIPARAQPSPAAASTSRPPVAYSHAQIHGWYSPDSSPSTIRRDSFDSAPSVWATPESQPGRRLSGATCISSGTFGV